MKYYIEKDTTQSFYNKNKVIIGIFGHLFMSQPHINNMDEAVT